MEHSISCTIVTGKMSIVLSYYEANHISFVFVTNLGVDMLIVSSHRTHGLRELDVIAFGLWGDLEESWNKEAKIRNAEEMYIIARFECVAQLLLNSQVFSNVTPCRPPVFAVKFRCSNIVSFIEVQFLSALLFHLTLHNKMLPSK
jgi:hypothetical protein